MSAKKKPTIVRLDPAYWREISLELEQHHAVFYKIWEMGRPVFSDLVDTACIQFDRGGDFVMFHFNPEYWEECTHYERLFTICHEALHVILNHGVRMKDAQDRQAVNVALDIVVNHMLVRNFGFDRTLIRNSDKLCWVDTVFKDKQHQGKPVPDDDCFEFYLNLFERVAIKIICGKGKKGKGQPCQGEGGGKDGEFQTLDDHSHMADSDGWDEVIDRLDKGLSDEEKETLRGLIDKHFEQDEDSEADKRAGSGAAGIWHFVTGPKAKPKKKWETVIKNWAKKYLTVTDRDSEQWARVARRFVMVADSGLFLPSEMEVENPFDDKRKIKVRFYLDTSGSCWHLKDRFFTAAESLPPDRFDVSLHCFDTKIYDTSLESRKVAGGGGTSFRILEEDVQQSMKKDAGKKGGQPAYPEAVFVMTDGYGDRVRPEKPERWYWFLSGVSAHTLRSTVAHYVPPECNLFNLNDFV